MKSRVLVEVTNSKYNNLNFMRFLAATMVIVCHAIPICYGATEEDIIGGLTHSKLNLGGIAVGVFFVTGGYLIAKSSERKKEMIPFFKARVKRIFPPLIIMVLVCTFIMGPILTNVSLENYFTNGNTYKYLLNMLLIPVHSLPGVFTENIYPQVVNGSLWTLPVEFLCYVGCFLAYKLGFFKPERFKHTIIVFFIGVFLFFRFFGENIVFIRIMRPVLLYYIGIGYYVYREKIQLNVRYGVAAAILFIFSILFNVPNIGMLFCFPYMIYFFAFGVPGKLRSFGEKFEVSYGMYLWAWPIQQILASECRMIDSWYENATITTILVMLVGLINNIIVEQRIWLKRRKK